MNKHLMKMIVFAGITLFGSTIAKSRPLPKISTYTAKPRTTYPKQPALRKTYIKKAPYAELGKTSKANGLLKSKIVPAHTKRTSKGYTLVNPYARSK